MNRSQYDIISSWQQSECVASIVCTTFNHERFLEDALRGFLAQRTTFPFEIIIHDDASSDRTADIIRHYHAKYPALIKPFLQNENQYSKGGFKPAPFAARTARGRYIALCEGDDFWIDPLKLQCQVDALEENPAIDFSFHAAYIRTEPGATMEASWNYGDNGVFDLDTLLNFRIGSFAPTASYVLRRRVFDELPPWFESEAPVGDFFLERYGARRGGAIYFNKPMSVYRQLTSGSWTVSVRENKAAYHRYLHGMCRSLPLMARDFEPFAVPFRRFCARFYLKYALEELARGDRAGFDDLIRLSVAQWKYVSRKQFIAYWLRWAPHLVRRLPLRRAGTAH